MQTAVSQGWCWQGKWALGGLQCPALESYCDSVNPLVIFSGGVGKRSESPVSEGKQPIPNDAPGVRVAEMRGGCLIRGLFS